jgi:hypothetical protein
LIPVVVLFKGVAAMEEVDVVAMAGVAGVDGILFLLAGVLLSTE